MELFYTDKNKLFNCKIQVEGAELVDTKARLILMFENKRNMIFFGEVDEDGECEISVPALKEIKEGKGTAILEVIADSTVFEPWESKFELKASKKVTVEVKSTDKKTIRENKRVDPKPKVSVVKTKEEPEDITMSEKIKNRIKKSVL